MNLANCLTFGSVINDSISQNGFPLMVLLPPPAYTAPSCPPTIPPPVDDVPPDWLLLHKDCYVNTPEPVTTRQLLDTAIRITHAS